MQEDFAGEGEEVLLVGVHNDEVVVVVLGGLVHSVHSQRRERSERKGEFSKVSASSFSAPPYIMSSSLTFSLPSKEYLHLVTISYVLEVYREGF